MKPGDKYIHFTKYGGINKGTVVSIHETHVVSAKHGVTYNKLFIRTDKGLDIALDGSDGKVYCIENELSPERCKQISDFMINLRRVKARKLKELEEMVQKRIDSGDLPIP